MVQVEGARKRRRGVPLVGVGLLAVLLTGCGVRVEQVGVSAPDPIAVPRSADGGTATSTFQGAVTAVDRAAGTVVVAVTIVWAPVTEARPHERRVHVDRWTAWEPGPGDISRLTVGEEVQVYAEDAPDGTWRAVKVVLMDID